jgi:hypothetical protein
MVFGRQHHSVKLIHDLKIRGTSTLDNLMLAALVLAFCV